MEQILFKKMKSYYQNKYATIYHGDCLKLLPYMPKVNLVLTDPPYGKTACKWDSIIPIKPLWGQLKRISTCGGIIVLTSSQPFTSLLICSNLGMFKYELIYEKTNAKGFLSAKKRPLTGHENILIFYQGNKTTYNPQKWRIPEYLRTKRKHATSHTSGEVYGSSNIKRWDDDGTRNPTSVIGFSNRVGRNGNYHPTQKPTALMEYLIKTYTNEKETVLDFAMGSGTTIVSAIKLNRQAIGIEIEEKYCEIAAKRLSQEVLDLAE